MLDAYRQSAGRRAADAYEATVKGLVVGVTEEALAELSSAAKRDLPTMWLDFVSRVGGSLGQDDHHDVTNGFRMAELLPVDWAVRFQQSVEVGCREASHPFDDPVPIVVAEQFGFPTVAVGGGDDPAVFQVDHWKNSDSRACVPAGPVLIALRLSSWLDRLVVPSRTQGLATSNADLDVLWVDRSTGKVDLLVEIIASWLRRIDTGEFQDGVSVETTLDASSAGSVTTISIGQFSGVQLRHSTDGLLVEPGRFAGRFVGHPGALLVTLIRLVSQSAWSGNSLHDRLGILNAGSAWVASPEQASERLEELLSIGDMDDVVAEVRRRVLGVAGTTKRE